MALSVNDAQYKRALPLMLSVAFIYCLDGCHYAECHFADCRGAIEVQLNIYFLLLLIASSFIHNFIIKFIFHNSSFSCQLLNGPYKLECLSVASLSCQVECSTLAY
jgi:hypothetical protein